MPSRRPGGRDCGSGGTRSERPTLQSLRTTLNDTPDAHLLVDLVNLACSRLRRVACTCSSCAAAADVPKQISGVGQATGEENSS